MDEDFDPYNEGNDDLELSNRFEQMLEMNEHYFFDVEEFEDLIDFYLEKNEMEKANKAIEFALYQHPNSSALKIKQAQYLIENHQPNKGLDILNALENMEPFNHELYLTKANIFSQIRQHQKAIENYYKAAKLIDDKTEKTNILFNIAFEYENLSQYDKALTILKDLLKENPENETVLYEISFCFNLKNDTENSITYFKSFIDENPYSYLAWFSLGIAYNKAELYEKAIDAYDYALAIKEDFSSAYFNKANSLAMLERYEDAIQTFKESNEYEEPDSTTFYYIGECYEKLEDYVNAENNYYKAINIDPYYADAYAGIAVVSEYQKKNHVAAFYIQKAIDLETNNSEFWYIYGDILANLEKYEEAINAFNKVIEIDETNEEIWLDISEAYLNKDGLQKAIDFLNESLENQPTNQQINIRLSALLLKAGKIVEANEKLNIALTIQPELASDFIEYFPEAISFPEILHTLENYKH